MKKKTALFVAMIFALSMLLMVGCSGLDEEYECLIGTWVGTTQGYNGSEYTATISEKDGKVYLEVSIRDYAGNVEIDELTSGEITYTDTEYDPIIKNPLCYNYRVGTHGKHLIYNIETQEFRTYNMGFMKR